VLIFGLCLLCPIRRGPVLYFFFNVKLWHIGSFGGIVRFLFKSIIGGNVPEGGLIGAF